jgi:hypothetical protein|tara:strand:- start:345 stop:539 length:195 start_codon:yes stop_codon:yes gene_type:complete
MENIKLTSVKLIRGLYNDFKAKTINSDITFQKVVNRTLSLYLTEESFKKRLDTEVDLSISGSNF